MAAGEEGAQGAQGAQLVIDSREPMNLKLKLVSLFSAGACDIRKLDFGDYRLPSGLLIERKTIADFLTSVGDGRLDRQLEGCAETSGGHAVLLLEGSWSVSPSGRIIVGHRVTGWSAKAFIKKLHTVQRRYGCQLLPSPTVGTTIQILKALAP